MANWFSRLFSLHRDENNAARLAQSENLLRLEREIQTMRIDLETREQNIAHLKQEVERLRARQDLLVTETVSAQLESLFSDFAAPASQMITQADLVENRGKPVQTHDVLSVSRRLVRAAERHGMHFEGEVGQQVAFDANCHTSLNPSTVPQPGQMVTVRFVGVSYQGKLIHKAIVE